MAGLVIDDSKAMRSLIGHILKNAGLAIFEGATVRRLWDVFAKSTALIWRWWIGVCPAWMATLSFAPCALSAYRKVCLIMVTAESEMEQVSRALAAGADEYIMKPFTRDAVLEKLKLLGILP